MIEKYESLIISKMQKDSLIGVGVAFINDTSIWKKGFGFSNKEKEIPFTTKTTLCIGSVTKPITAIGMMQLQEKEVINIDKPLVNYLPEFSIKTRNADIKDITVRSVINHTSGIPNDINVYNQNDTYKSTVNHLKDEYLVYSPNLIDHYSNVGYCLLGHTISNVSQQEYPDYMVNHIFTPIGMQNTGFKKYKNLKHLGKTYDKNGKYHPLKDSRNIPSGFLYSNIDDLSLFAQELIAIYHGKENGFISPKTAREIFSLEKKRAVLDNFYKSTGFKIAKNNSSIAFIATGSNHVSNAGIVIEPNKKRAIIFQVNTVGGMALINEGIDVFLSNLGLNSGNIYAPNTTKKQVEKPNHFPKDSLSQHFGCYPTAKFMIDVMSQEDKLILNYGGTNFQLDPITKNEFKFSKVHSKDSIQPIPNQKFIFKDIDNKHFLFVEDGNGTHHILSFLTKPQTIDVTWKERLGTYKIISKTIDSYEMYSEVKLSISDDNALQLTIAYTSGIYNYNMTIENDFELIFCGFGADRSGETVQFYEKKYTNFMKLDGLTLQKID